MATITIALNKGVTTQGTHGHETFYHNTLVGGSSGDMVLTFDSTKYTTVSQFKTAFADLVAAVMSGVGGVTT